jgi:asparagine synthetase B (glutamine-hydrolysing)
MNVRVLGPLDPNFAWDGTKLLAEPEPDLGFRRRVRGAAAWAHRAGRARWRIGRDPLGLNKLFWAQGTDGALLLASRPWRLVREGCAFESVWAIPRGAVIELGPAEQQVETSSIGDGRQPFEPFTVEVLGERIRSVLDTYMEAIASVHGAEQVYVCLSGGLDSSAIAALAREHFPRLVAVSFDLTRRAGVASEDRRIATRLARDLGLHLLEVTVGADWLLETLDIVLLEGIDWRDFNVHAALVNAALARGIREDSPKADSVIVLTGDLANEFLADYQPEEYAGTTHYPLPRLALGALRASLIQGLDTCNREVGVFSAWDLAVVQPYAAAVDEYLAIPDEFLSDSERKRHLGRAMVGDLLPEYVFQRAKTRAQIGGEGAEGGVLAACVDRGLDGPRLQRRFADLHGIENPSELNRFIRAGRYRAAVPSIVRNSHECC